MQLEYGRRGGAVTLSLLGLNGLFMSGVYALAKVAREDGISSLGMLAWQVLFAAAVVGAAAALRGQWPAPTAANLRYAAASGVLGITGPSLVTFSAVPHVPTGLIGVIAALSPVFTYAIALAARVERLQAARAAGIVLGLAGVMAVLLPRGALPDAHALPWALFALAGPLLLAGGNVFRSVAWPGGLPPLAAASLLLALQAVVLVPLAVLTGHFRVPHASAGGADIALLGAGALTSGFYLGAFELQRRAGPVVVGQLGYVMTAASLAIGVIAFDERYSAATLAAVLVVLAGVALVNRQSMPARAGVQP